MMRKYRVQMMNERDYAKYMAGYNGHINIKEVMVEAENAKDVREYFEAKYPKKVINIEKED